MPTCRLVDFDSKNLAFQPLRSNEGGKGKTAYINVRGGENLFQCPRVRMPFALKPGMGETTVKVSLARARELAAAHPHSLVPQQPFMKMKLVCTINPDDAEQAAAIEKLRQVDSATVDYIWEKRNQIYPAEKLKYMTEKHASLMPSFNPLVKDGKVKDDGSAYAPTFTIQVPNMADLVDHLIIEKKEKDGKTEDMCKDVVWKDMLVSDYKPPEKQPTMYLCYGKNETGQDIISKTTTVRRADGTVLTDAAGQVVKRWVGPQDMVPGSIVRPVFKFSKVYVIAGFGTHLELAAIIIEPPTPRASAVIEGAVEVDNYDPLLTARVLSAIVPQAEEAAPESPAHEAPEAPVPSLEALDMLSPKRKADEPAPRTSKKKKTEE